MVEESLRYSRNQGLLCLLTVGALLQAAVREHVISAALLFLKHTHSPVVSSAHMLFCAAFRHVCAVRVKLSDDHLRVTSARNLRKFNLPTSIRREGQGLQVVL